MVQSSHTFSGCILTVVWQQAERNRRKNASADVTNCFVYMKANNLNENLFRMKNASCKHVSQNDSDLTRLIRKETSVWMKEVAYADPCFERSVHVHTHSKHCYKSSAWRTWRRSIFKWQKIDTKVKMQKRRKMSVHSEEMTSSPVFLAAWTLLGMLTPSVGQKFGWNNHAQFFFWYFWKIR